MAHQKSQQNQKGFTLVELIIVVSIIAVLASLAFMALSGETAQARDSKRLADIKVFEDAIATSNGKNKKIDYNNNSELGSVPNTYTAEPTVYQITTSAGTITPLRGAYLIPVREGLFDSDVIPTVSRDPKGSQYYAAFLSATDYQIFGTQENPDTKTATAIVRGSFKEGAILDILMNDINDSITTIPVSNGRRFVAGDTIKIDSEEMTVVTFNVNTSPNSITVAARGSGAVHNKSTAIKLKTAAAGADSLVCLGTVSIAGGGAAIATTANFRTAMYGTDGTDGEGAVCNTTDTAVAGAIVDDGAPLPYIVGAE